MKKIPKLKDLLKESNVWDRQFGESLPTLKQCEERYKHKLTEARKYKLGDSWSKDFDYEGMLKWGMSVDWRTDEERLLLLHHSLEDVNYHNIAVPLWDAMVALKTDKESKAKSLLKKVNVLSKKEFR